MIRVRPSSQAPVPIALAIKEAFNVFIDRHTMTNVTCPLNNLTQIEVPEFGVDCERARTAPVPTPRIPR
jgi:hypothetical protein